MRRLAGLLALLGLFLLPSTVLALPLYEGMTFKQIQGPDDPEEFSWEVTLYEGQELKQVNDQQAVVYWDDGTHVALTINAAKAHDAIGTTVPTSLSVSGSNVVTLTVHHRAGNPAAGGVAFAYPLSEGDGWEGGISTVSVTGPPDEERLRTDRERREVEERQRSEALEGCRIPHLNGRSLRAAGRRLRGAGCKLGKVRGERSRGAKVVKQDLRPGTPLPVGSTISVKLG